MRFEGFGFREEIIDSLSFLLILIHVICGSHQLGMDGIHRETDEEGLVFVRLSAAWRIGKATASDPSLLKLAAEENRIIVSLHADPFPPQQKQRSTDDERNQRNR